MKQTLVMTVDAVIEALGGASAVASLTGQTLQNVSSNWRVRKSIPPHFYVLMQEELSRRGLIAPPALWGMVDIHTVKRRQRVMAARAKERAGR